MYRFLVCDVSRTGVLAGVRLIREEETGWAYAELGDRLYRPVLHRVPSLRSTASSLTRTASPMWLNSWYERTPDGAYSAEWCRAPEVRAATDAFRRHRATWFRSTSHVGRLLAAPQVGTGVDRIRMSAGSPPAACPSPARNQQSKLGL
jgi:hypothetical protein